MGAYQPKTWQQKLNNGKEPQVKTAGKAFAGIHAGQKMLIPTPRLIDAYIRQLPKGKTVDSHTLRNDLALEYGADVTCPMTTGIFLRIVAEAAYEEFRNGKPVAEITPFWRVMDEKSNTAKKLTFGTGFLKELRKKEAYPFSPGGRARG